MTVSGANQTDINFTATQTAAPQGMAQGMVEESARAGGPSRPGGGDVYSFPEAESEGMEETGMTEEILPGEPAFSAEGVASDETFPLEASDPEAAGAAARPTAATPTPGALQNVATFFYAWDHLGTVRLVSNQDRTMLDRHDYQPFGVELRPIRNQTSNTHQFTGHERDLQTGYDYMHYRFYGSTLGRFLKPDNIPGALTDPQSWNLYAYVRNNPANATDPTGHFSDLFLREIAASPSSDQGIGATRTADGTPPPAGQKEAEDLNEKTAAEAHEQEETACWQSQVDNALAEALGDNTGSNVVYDAHTGTAYVISDGKIIGSYPMSHNVAKGNLYLGNGTYAFMDKEKPYTHGDKKDKKGVKLDSQNGAYGPFGIFRLDYSYTTDPSHFGIGIHSGRIAFDGFCSMTAGCFRTTDEGMAAISAAAAWLPLKKLYTVNEPCDTHVVQQSGRF